MGARGDEMYSYIIIGTGFCMYSYRNWIESESPCIQLRLEATMFLFSISLFSIFFLSVLVSHICKL